MTTSNNIHRMDTKPVSGLTVAVPTPFNGADLMVLSSPGGTLAFDFDPRTASAVYHEGANDLVFVLNGGKVTIRGFFLVADERLPDFKLPDGSIILSSDFFEGNFDTTADPAPESSPSSGGIGEYGDDPGSLISGIERLGSLGTIYWDRFTERPEHYLDNPHHASGAPDMPVFPSPPLATDTTPVSPSPLFPDGTPASPPLPPPATHIKASGANLQVHEDGLSWGTSPSSMDHSTSTSGYVEIISYSGIGTITFSVGDIEHTITMPAGWDGGIPYVPDSESTFAAALGTMTIDRVAYNPGTGNYEAHFTYTLQSNTTAHSQSGASDAEHHDRLSEGNAPAQAAMPKIDVVVKDTAGASSDVNTIAVDVSDDGPKLDLSHVDTGYQVDNRWVDDGLIHLGNSYTTTGVITPDYGADRAFGDGPHYLQIAFGKPSEVDNAKLLRVEFDDDGKAAVKTLLGTIEFTKQDEKSIVYKYIAGNGQVGESEKIIFTVMDGDQDIAGKSMAVMLDQAMPAGTSRVDEAALINRGSFHEGHGPATQSFSVFLSKGTTEFTWDIETIRGSSFNSIKADADGDGVYTQAVWSVDGSGNLIATAEGKSVLTVTPPQSGENGLILHQSEDGRWYGTMATTLKYPIQHAAPPNDTESDYNVKDLSLGFKAVYTEANAARMTMSNAVSVAVIDDAPIAREVIAKVVEAVASPEDVYLVMDASTSIKKADFAKGMTALSELIQKYISEGIEARFSLATFASEAHTWGVNLSAAQMLTLLNHGLSGKTNDEISAYWRSGIGLGTNYDAALDSTQRLIQAAQNDGTLRYYNQKVYFISDGEPTAGIDKNFGSWKNFIQQHGATAGYERIEVYAVGVGTALNDDNNWNKLMEVTTDGSGHGIKVTNYADLADKIVRLVEPNISSGNLLGVDNGNDDTRSADLVTVVSVEVNGKTYGILDSTGTTGTIAIAEGIWLKVSANGDYFITSRKSIDSDQHYTLKYTIRDNDGDTRTTDLKIVLKDADPVAFDNVAGVPDANYRNGSAFILGDFSDAQGGWRSANDRTEYNQTFSNGGYTKIDGTPSALNSNVSFAKIMPLFNDGMHDDAYFSFSFSKALSYVTGKHFTEIFDAQTAPLSGSYIGKNFDLFAEGSIKFNYIFVHGTGPSVSTREKAFWILLDENKNVYKQGLITSSAATSHGVITVGVENAGQYTLMLGCYDANASSSSNTMPILYINKVMYAPASASDIYHGNVIEDNSPQGKTDTLGDHAVLHNIHFTDMNNKVHEYTVGEGAFSTGLLVLKDIFTHGDKLTLNDNGNYVYQTPTGRSFDNANIEYSIKEPGSSDIDSAMLYIRSGDYRHEGSDIDLSGRSGGSHIVIGGDADNILIGSDGDDIIFGGAGNNLIYGGAGNNIMYGGEGSDTFAWREGDYDGGTDVIKDYILGTDHLSFGDIFGGSVDGDIPLKVIQTALEGDKVNISVDAQNNSVLNMTVKEGTHVQNVEIHLSDSSLTSPQIAEINAGVQEAQAALLQQILTNIAG